MINIVQDGKLWKIVNTNMMMNDDGGHDDGWQLKVDDGQKACDECAGDDCYG